MKKSIKKIIVLLLIFSTIFCTKSYCNMSVDGIEKSMYFYDKNRLLINTTSIISELLKIIFIFFIIITPFIIIYKYRKLKKANNEQMRYKIKTLVISEILFIINGLLIYIVDIIKFGSKSELLLNCNIFIIIISCITAFIIMKRSLKKEKYIMDKGEEK